MENIYEISIRGIRPLLMNNGRLANPLDPHTKALKASAKKRDPTEEDLIETHRLGFVGGMYHDAKQGPVIPADNLLAMTIEGARRRKLGKEFEALVDVLEPNGAGYPLQYKGPRDIESLWSQGYYLIKGVSIGKRTVMRTRPRFPSDWQVQYRVSVLDSGTSREQLEQAVEDAGIYKGLGDWAPRYGRFIVESVKQIS